MDETLHRFRQQCLEQRLGVATLRQYRATAEQTERETGLVLSYSTILRHIGMLANRVSAGRLRAIKSAGSYVMKIRGTPLTTQEDYDLNQVLEGLTCWKGQPRRRRGAPAASDVEALVTFALDRGHKVEACAITIGDACAIRPRDLVELTVENVDLPKQLIWVQRKARRVVKVREGNLEAHPILTPEGLMVLSELCSNKAPHERVLPECNLQRITQIVKEVATQARWDPDLLWSGAHNLRHGRASTVYEEALRAVQKAGAWSSSVGVRVYAEVGRGRRKRPRS